MTDTEIPSVELRSVTKRFGGLVAVDDLNLELAGGEFFTLLGPSGCGKTTTLRMIAGFERPSEGAIRIEGADVAELPPHRRPTNTVFQSYALFPHLSVRENVAFGLKRKRVSRAEIAERVSTELERVGLAAEANRRPAQLSGGMQQRVALARALVNLPKVLLLDEPLGALDLKLRKGLQVELKKIQREVGITFVYVTHDQGEALTMSDRIAVMNNGLVEQLASPREVYERPATRFVADFIGTTNIIAGAARAAGGDAVLDLGGDSRVVVAMDGRSIGDEVVVTVRPEKIALSKSRVDADCMVSGRVAEVVYQGTFTAYAVDTPHGERLLCHRLNLEDASDVATVGDQVWLTWAKRHSYPIRSTPEGS
ncbi:MAG TPA: ABC transporter ATP-binding protein [Solirubrobacterales bacterium]|nr:ABC transporter ATP-binding protein [Solirubrobacterales bacterium]